MRLKALSISVIGALMALAVIVQPVTAAGIALYDSIPSPLPTSTPSLGFEAEQTAEFGAKVQFATGERTFDSVKVVMNSWACESGQWEQKNCVTTPGATFSQELTLNLYADNSGTLTPIKSVTQTFDIPYRPSTNLACGVGATQWMDAEGHCQNGMNVPVTFNLNSTVLPDQVVYGIEYNTFAWGYSKVGVTGPYDSLNVSVVAPTSTTSGVTLATYRAFGATPVFALDSEYNGQYVPAVQFNVAKSVAQDACKNNGWKTLNGGYKNQGQCVASVVSNGNSKLHR